MPQGSMAVMLGAALTTIRHTRTEEASGRTELIFSKDLILKHHSFDDLLAKNCLKV
jgi:putative exporter of polyketide antibiotics